MFYIQLTLSIYLTIGLLFSIGAVHAIFQDRKNGTDYIYKEIKDEFNNDDTMMSIVYTVLITFFWLPVIVFEIYSEFKLKGE